MRPASGSPTGILEGWVERDAEEEGGLGPVAGLGAAVDLVAGPGFGFARDGYIFS